MLKAIATKGSLVDRNNNLIKAAVPKCCMKFLHCHLSAIWLFSLLFQTYSHRCAFGACIPRHILFLYLIQMHSKQPLHINFKTKQPLRVIPFLAVQYTLCTCSFILCYLCRYAEAMYILIYGHVCALLCYFLLVHFVCHLLFRFLCIFIFLGNATTIIVIVLVSVVIIFITVICSIVICITCRHCHKNKKRDRKKCNDEVSREEKFCTNKYA